MAQLNGTRPTILIVDDEPLNIDFLEQELEDMGYLTISAGDGQSALDLMSSEAPDLVLLDIMMPVMDGFDVLTQAKSDETLRHIPVIVISAMTDMDSVIRGIELGAEDYLPKPFDEVLLQARISSSLEKKRLHDLEQKHREALEHELAIGREIQAGFLPDAIPDLPGWEIASYFEAAREVAGDFYDVFWVERIGRLALILGDVCDKGVGSALYMALFRSLLRSFSNPESFGSLRVADDASVRLQNAVTMVNNYIAAVHGDSNMFTTLFFGLLDPESGSLLYINGGQEPPFWLDGGSSQRLMPTGPMVGLWPGAEFGVQEVTMNPGDRLIVYSDGLPDAQNPALDYFGDEAFAALIADQSDVSADAIQQALVNAVFTFAEDYPQGDDITLLIVARA